MLKAIISLIKPDPTALRDRFMARYQGRTLIVHEGLSIGWVAELLKEAGGGGHFRLDARMPRTAKPTPIEWIVHQHILPQKLPLPVLVKIEKTRLLVRHLNRNQNPVHPSEIYWMLGEMPNRVHLTLTIAGVGFAADRGLPVSDNDVSYDF